MENYEWKTVIYDGEEWEWYQACPEGHIRRNPLFMKGVPRTSLHTYRTQLVNKKTGYTHTRLARPGRSKSISIHRIIGETFVPNPEGHTEIDHIDRNKENNRADNLRWVTRRQNMANVEGKKAIKPIWAFPPDGSTPLYFDCIRDAAAEIAKITGQTYFPQGISNVLNIEKYTHYKGWKFKLASAVN